MKRGEASLAQKYLEKAKRQAPDSVHIYLKIASILVQEDKLNQAEKVLKEAKKINPENLDIYLALIFVYSYREEGEKLESEYESFLEKAHQIKPENMTISSYLAQFYFYKKKPEKAITLYERILKDSPDNLEAFFWLGYLYDEVGKGEKAKKIWRQGLEANSSYAPILNALAYSYAEQGVKLDEAEGLIKKALETEPRNGAYLDTLGWIYFKKEKLDKAKEYIEKAINYTQDPEIYQHLGNIYVELGKEEEGLEVYRKGLEKFPDYQGLKKEIEIYEKKNKKNKE